MFYQTTIYIYPATPFFVQKETAHERWIITDSFLNGYPVITFSYLIDKTLIFFTIKHLYFIRTIPRPVMGSNQTFNILRDFGCKFR